MGAKGTKEGIPLEVRVWRYIDPHGPNGCWQWTGEITRGGYGSIHHNGKPTRKSFAHRLVYQLLDGPIPEGLVLDHLCRNPGCVNPDHLEAVTSGENIRRGFAVKAWPTECPKGHPFDEKNTGARTPNCPKAGRRCLTCHREREKRRRDAKKAALGFEADAMTAANA